MKAYDLSLSDFPRKRYVISDENMNAILFCITSGLTLLQDLGITHNDIKADNYLVTVCERTAGLSLT